MELSGGAQNSKASQASAQKQTDNEEERIRRRVDPVSMRYTYTSRLSRCVAAASRQRRDSQSGSIPFQLIQFVS